MDGRNVRIDYRWAVGDADRVRYAAELVAITPDVILATTGATVGALQQASRSVPIVFVTVIDPVGGGWVASLARPRRSTLICCLSTRISASSATCDRNRSLAIPKINRHKSSIGYQHRAILSQLPARLNLRQGQLRSKMAKQLFLKHAARLNK
jgi:hypothetical protein